MEAQPTGAVEAAERKTLELRSKEAKIMGLHEKEGQVDELGIYINEKITQKMYTCLIEENLKKENVKAMRLEGV